MSRSVPSTQQLQLAFPCEKCGQQYGKSQGMADQRCQGNSLHAKNVHQKRIQNHVQQPGGGDAEKCTPGVALGAEKVT